MKHKIEIEGLPEGWMAVAYRAPKYEEYFLSKHGIQQAKSECHSDLWLIVEKIQPRRIVLEETDIDTHFASTQYFSRDSFDVSIQMSANKIWREVE